MPSINKKETSIDYKKIIHSQAGPNSGLHIIIFDEIDAICKARGSVGGNTGVHDTVVNQLLAKIDGLFIFKIEYYYNQSLFIEL